MNSREGVIRAIEMTGPDRIPIMHDTLPGARARFGEALDGLHRQFPDDVIHVGSATYGEFGLEIGTPSRDPWGSLWVRHNDEHKGQVVAGVVYDPAKDELFFAEKGQGAFMNDTRLRVSGRSKMIEGLFFDRLAVWWPL